MNIPTAASLIVASQLLVGMPFAAGLADLNALLLDGARTGKFKTYATAIDAGANANALDDGGNSALVLAAHARNYFIVRELLAHGADPNGRGSLGHSALGIAVVRGDAQIVRTLIKAGADVSERDSLGNPPLADAIRLKHGQVAQLLLGAGADPDAPGVDGLPPLMIAAKNGDVALMDLLREKQADLNVRDASGRTAMYWAVFHNNLDAVRFLANHKAEIEGVTPGYSAVSIARRLGRKEIAELLVSECNCS